MGGLLLASAAIGEGGGVAGTVQGGSTSSLVQKYRSGQQGPRNWGFVPHMGSSCEGDDRLHS